MATELVVHEPTAFIVDLDGTLVDSVYERRPGRARALGAQGERRLG